MKSRLTAFTAAVSAFKPLETLEPRTLLSTISVSAEPVAIGSKSLAGSNLVVAAFTDSDNTLNAGSFNAGIDWGDNSTSSGSVVSDGNGGYVVVGSHSYAVAGAYGVNVTVNENSPGSATAGVTSPAQVGTVNQRAVATLYRDLLNRQVELGGLNLFTQYLDHGGKVLDIVNGIVNSTEYRTDRVQDVYQDLLGRAPDGAGMAAWVNFLGNGGTVEQMAVGIAGSQEYFNRKGGNATAFVIGLYRDALGRDPDNAPALVLALQNGTLTDGDVASAVINSMEYRRDTISTFYLKFLGRSPEAAGRDFFANQLGGGVHDETIIAALINAHEYFVNRIAAAGKPTESVVNQLYEDLLGRPADSAGMTFFANQIDAGQLTRDGLVKALANSQEYRGAQINSDYQHLLGRNPSISETKYWMGQINNGAKNEAVIAGLVSTDEYFNRHGGNNAGFVTAMYQDLLGRPPESQALSNWVSQLNSAGTGWAPRQNAAAAILAGTEYQGIVVDQIFQHFLHRTVDAGGRVTFVGLMQAGAKDEEIIADVISSDEYFSDVA